MIEQVFDLDIVPSGRRTVVHVSQYDKLGRTLTARLYSGGVRFTIPTGAVAEIQGTKPDATGFKYTMTISGSSVSIPIEEQMAAVSGSVECEVVISLNDERIATANFTLDVEKSALDDETIISETDIPIFRSFATGGSEGQIFVHDDGDSGSWQDTDLDGTVWGEITGNLEDQTDLANELQNLSDDLSAKVASVNTVTPDTNGNVSLNAEDIPAEGIGYKYAEGNPLVITDGIAENADDLKVEFEPIQDLHGYDHPWAGGTGKNLYDSSIYDAYKQADGSYAGAVDQINISTYISSNLVGVELTLSAYIKVPSGSTVINFRVLAIVNGERIYGNNATGNAYILSKVTFTPQSTSDRILFTYSEKGDAPNVEFKDVQLELGSTATSYEPYSNICPISGRTQVEIVNRDSEDVEQSSATVQLGQTVYGGTLDVTTGELVVRTANIASYNGETIGEPWWSSMDEYVAGTTPTTGAQVVYTLANPVTSTLTPTQLQLLEGYNILTTDGDTINLRYIGTEASNIQAEIDEFEESTRKLAGSLAMVETSPATANHSVGDLIVYNNQLYKVTVSIASGEAIVVGTNVSATTVANELMAILAQLSA